MRKWSSSKDDDYCLVNVVSSFRYPKRTNSVLWWTQIKMRYIGFGTRKEGTLFWWAQIKRQTLSKNVKIDPQEYVYKGSSPSWESEVHPQMMTSVYSFWYIDFVSRKERALFWWAKIKTWTLSKHVKIDPQEYVLQGYPLPLLSTKTPET